MSGSWGIVGGGFAAYGYLPALVEEGVTQVFMLEKYQPFIKSRADIGGYLGSVSFVNERNEIFEKSDSLVIAVPPNIQESYVNTCLNKKYQCLLLEKPVSSNPAIANQVLKTAINSCQSLRVGYIFSMTAWGANLLRKKCFRAGYQYKIFWLFQAHHFKFSLDTWKVKHGSGGGVLRFYGIQLIALLSEIGSVEAIESTITCDENKDSYKWNAIFRIDNSVEIQLEVDSASPVNSFGISSNDSTFMGGISLAEPFEAESRIDNLDLRVGPLRKLIQSLEHDDASMYSTYYCINAIWDLVEEKSTWHYN
jgi:hypothetical protein